MGNGSQAPHGAVINGVGHTNNEGVKPCERRNCRDLPIRIYQDVLVRSGVHVYEFKYQNEL